MGLQDAVGTVYTRRCRRMLVSLTLMAAAATVAARRDPVAGQLDNFKERFPGPIGVLTTSNGAPVPYPEATSTLNEPLINNEFFMDGITRLDRERIPERVVHAKGSGAFGYFKVTHDIKHICKASFLSEVGKETPVAVRFSTSGRFRGSSDLVLDVRGFATKFYTEEGNFDIVGFNTPMYFFNDPVKFFSAIHASKPNPVTNTIDVTMFWDMLTLIPEILHTVIYLFSGRGLPATYRNMPGYGIHTYQVQNCTGDTHFVRFHVEPDAGPKNLRLEEATQIGATDPDNLINDLFRAIGNCDFPSWTVSVQILNNNDIKKMDYKAFDVTRVIPEDKFPLHPVGKLVLNRNPKNHFAEIEQLAFCPVNVVPGILGAPDKIFESRRLSYRETQLYRLGVNFKNIPVNCPFHANTLTYNRDGSGALGKEGDAPNYYPNSFNGPVPYMPTHYSNLIKIIEKKADNFDQAGELYAKGLTDSERSELIINLVASLQTVTELVRERAIKLFTVIHPDLGFRLAQGFNCTTM